jgi:hypothetical protein
MTMSNSIHTPTIDPVTPEEIEAVMRRAHKEHSDAFWSIVGSLVQRLVSRDQAGTAEAVDVKHLPVPY